MWNEEPCFVNLIPIIFVFTFVYSIILYAFSKVTEGNMLVPNHMIKMSCFRSDRRFAENFVCRSQPWKILMRLSWILTSFSINFPYYFAFSSFNSGQFGSGLCSRTMISFSSATFSGYWSNILCRSDGSDAKLYSS